MANSNDVLAQAQQVAASIKQLLSGDGPIAPPAGGEQKSQTLNIPSGNVTPAQVTRQTVPGQNEIEQKAFNTDKGYSINAGKYIGEHYSPYLSTAMQKLYENDKWSNPYLNLLNKHPLQTLSGIGMAPTVQAQRGVDRFNNTLRYSGYGDVSTEHVGAHIGQTGHKGTVERGFYPKNLSTVESRRFQNLLGQEDMGNRLDTTRQGRERDIHIRETENQLDYYMDRAMKSGDQEAMRASLAYQQQFHNYQMANDTTYRNQAFEFQTRLSTLGIPPEQTGMIMNLFTSGGALGRTAASMMADILHTVTPNAQQELMNMAMSPTLQQAYQNPSTWHSAWNNVLTLNRDMSLSNLENSAYTLTGVISMARPIIEEIVKETQNAVAGGKK